MRTPTALAAVQSGVSYHLFIATGAPQLPKQRFSQKPRTGNQLRIIGGMWRGRKLDFPDADGLRPSGDRVRETLFNWLNFSLPGTRCLDLFAGSGALGLEALSRGAEHAVLVERNAAAANSLRNSCNTLQANAIVMEADALSWLEQGAGQAGPFDVVFLDPPFGKDFLAPACRMLEEKNLLADQAFIYVECAAAEAPSMPGNWRLHRDKTSGQVAYRLYTRSHQP